MPERKIKITVTRTSKAPGKESKEARNGATKQKRADSPPAESKRPSPVTDLLFDKPKSNAAPDTERDAARQAESGRPVYHISIVAEMVETHPQTLRMYERMGLLNPQRTPHNVRLYSDDDVEQVRRIQHLTQDLGVNLAGVEVVFKLLRELHQLREELETEE